MNSNRKAEAQDVEREFSQAHSSADSERDDGDRGHRKEITLRTNCSQRGARGPVPVSKLSVKCVLSTGRAV